MASWRAPILVLGIGNADRGDDAAGPETARQLEGCFDNDVEVSTHGGEATSLVEHIEESGAVIFIDACASGAPPGHIHRFDVAAAPLPAQVFSISTHGFGLPSALELARALGVLPQHAIVYAIEGASFEAGAPLSAAVAAATKEAARLIRGEIAALMHDQDTD
jgi:hydrogenase maturation protease